MNTNSAKRLCLPHKTIQAILAKHLLILILLISTSLFFQPAFSAEKGMDVALVLDTSGSMKKNDPNQLRIQAAKLFVSLLSRKDKVSLIGFSNRAYPVTPLLSLNTKKNETKLLKAIDKMATNGRYTNLHDAIQGGYDLLKKQKSDDRTRHIILMSDGKMDLGNKERNLSLLEKTLEDLPPKLAEEDIKVHTIAFTSDSYIPLLKLAAEDTGGQFVMLKNANGIHQVFENMFERTKNPDMLPLKEDSFVVDKNVKEVTIVASKFKYNTVVAIQSPEGEELTLKNHDQNVKWYKARKFDLITIKNPIPGYWLIKYSEGGNKAYIVSDISLEASTTKKRAEPEAPLHIQAQLKRKDRRIKNKSLLKSTKFTVKVTSPTGAVIENTLVDDGSEIGSERKDGIYGISYAFEKQGPYKIEVTASGETFDRKKTLFVDVKSQEFKAPFKLQADNIPTPDMLDSLNENKNNKQAGQASTEASSDTKQTEHNTDKNEHSNADPGQASTEAPHIELPDIGVNNDIAHGDEESDENHEDTAHDSTDTGDEEHGDELKASSDFGVKDAVVAFISFNVFLFLLGGGYYFWNKRKQKQKSKDNDDDGEKDEDISESTQVPSEGASDIELSPEDDLSTSISEAELEAELSSILDDEKK